MEIKQDLCVGNLSIELLFALYVTACFFRRKGRKLLVSCICGSNFRCLDGSYLSYVFGYFIEGVFEYDVDEIASCLRLRLGDDYSVLVESNRVRVQYDPD